MSNVPRLYRQILKLAKVFPSSNKESIIEEIKLQFHRDKHMDPATQAAEIAKRFDVAYRGIEQMSQYTSLRDTSGSEWSVQLEKNPMPRPEGDGDGGAGGDDEAKR
mmetsp:Transcript_31536/g.100080  ORF Transcript_31536/g.100080 Transcript_31536/m.100080 type:complete len:106 (-) Transcript_31536:96-413(-)|eukprot:CAMPEP_0118857764 /NCGR_PEP_ID=MMETSP1163-20130328/4708_1 /TAXON_ID=124430 /ORGANISM="Phaeomonas parva, Strain CCMP2877" /LENGTH=105 /DNA_ID=CAMNT_0006791105 /DNA_START=1394 /DNA_END=1711 /DNA_ORIENTATION=+